MPRKWSKEIVVRHILERHRGGKKLSSDYMQKNSLPLYMAAVWYWSGWRQAIEGAGLNYDDVRIKTPKRKVVWNEKIIVQTILSLHKQGEPLNSNHAQTKHPLLYRAAYVYFEGWAQAVTTAGLDYGSVRKKKPMRKEVSRFTKIELNSTLGPFEQPTVISRAQARSSLGRGVRL